MAARIHSTAIVSPDAQLASDVEVGPYVIIEGPATVGAGCILRPFAQLCGRVTLGEGNDVGRGCILGERPQHKGYAGDDTSLVIGNRNIFREHVTVHRGMPEAGGKTVIGDDGFFMAGSHVAHDCRIGHHVIFANCAAVAGHVFVDDGVFLSGNALVHQHVHIGRLSLLSGGSAVSQDVPPFWIIQGYNKAMGINVVGMKRAGIDIAAIQAVRSAYKALYFDQQSYRDTLSLLESQYAHVPAVMEVTEFVRASRRGIPGVNGDHRDSFPAAA